MREHTIAGGGGLKLHVEEAGNPDGIPLLFIHGWSQCRLAWAAQIASDLADDFRLVTMDNRGHGLSEKPRGVYADSKLWADDVHAVIAELGLDRPVVSGWSYGGMIICDYLRVHGGSALRGIHLVNAITRLGTDAASEVIGGAFLRQATASYTMDVEGCVEAIEGYMRLVTHAGIPFPDWYTILGYNVAVPPYVREQLFARTVENHDVLPLIDLPVLITHGDRDPIVLPAAGEQHARLIPHAVHSVYPDVGHAPFAEAPDRFNRELREFASRTGSAGR